MRDPVLWLLLALAFGVRAGILALYPEIEGRGDESLHYVQGVLTGQLGHEVIGRWSPAYEFFLGGVFASVSASPLTAKAMQVLVSSLTVALVYGLGALAGGQRTARIAAVLAAFHPSLVAYSHYLYSETLFLFLLSGAAFAFHTGDTRAIRSVPSAAAALLFGLAALTRGLVIYFLPVWFAWEWLRGRRAEALRIAAVSALALFVVLPWTLRNAAHHGGFMLVDPTLGRTAFLAFNSERFNRDLGFVLEEFSPLERERCPTTPATDREPLPRVGHLLHHFPPEAERFTRDAGGLAALIAHTRHEASLDFIALQRCEVANAIDFTRREPTTVLGHVFARLYAFWGPNSFLLRSVHEGVYPGGPLGKEHYGVWKWLVVGSTVALVSLALLGLGRSPMPPVLVWSLLFAVFYTGLHVLAVSYSRYRLPLMPFVIVAAASWLASPRVPAPRWRAALVGGALLLFVGGALHYAVVHLP